MNVDKGVKKIQDNQEHGVELISILTKQSPGSKLAAFSNSTIPSSSKKSDTPY
jgi:hypothetical protein